MSDYTLDECMANGRAIDSWKYRHCWHRWKRKCKGCLSGGMMIGAMCEETLHDPEMMMFRAWLDTRPYKEKKA